MIKKIAVIFTSFLLAASVLLTCADSASFADNSVGSSEAVSKETTADDHPSFLFIGNSRTYYSNMPEMFYYLVKRGLGITIDRSVLCYSNRTLKQHAKSISAVIRTKGDPSQLKASEKSCFTLKASNAFSRKVYNAYKNIIFNKDGSKKTYDYLVLQEHGQKNEYEQYKDGTLSILNDFCTEDSRVVLVKPSTEFTENYTLNSYSKLMDTQDRDAEKLKSVIETKIPCKEVMIAYTGRAVCNYLFYAGENGAQKKAPDEYRKYNKTLGLTNDLIIGDGIHPTQLCTYLFACCLYSAVYRESPVSTVSDYHASVRSSVLNLKTQTAGKNYALRNTISEVSLLRTAAFVAFQTQCKDLRLRTRSQAKAFRSEYPEYTYRYSLKTPKLKSIKADGQSIRITWKGVPGAKNYLVYRKTSTGWRRLGTTTKTAFTDRDLKAGKTCTYTVRCVNKEGNETLSLYDTTGISCKVPD